MEKKNKIILLVLFLIIIIAFIYGYSCNTFILGGDTGSGDNSNSLYQCYIHMKEGRVCPDCTTMIVNGNLESCPTSVGTKMCNNGNLND